MPYLKLPYSGNKMKAHEVFNTSLYEKAEHNPVLNSVLESPDNAHVIDHLVENPNAYEQFSEHPAVVSVLESLWNTRDTDSPTIQAYIETDLMEIFDSVAWGVFGAQTARTKKKSRDIVRNPSKAHDYRNDQDIKAIMAEHRRQKDVEQAASLKANLRVLQTYEQLLNGIATWVEPLQSSNIVVLRSKVSLIGSINEIQTNSNRGYINGMLDYLLECIKLGEPLEKICLHAFFQNHPLPEHLIRNPLKGLSARSLLGSLLKCTEGFVSSKILEMYAMQGLPMPLISPSVSTDDPSGARLIWQCPLRAFYPFLLRQQPTLVSLGLRGSMGKSRLLNSIFHTAFSTSQECVDHEGVEFLPSTEEFQRGMGILDMHGSALWHPHVVGMVQKIFPESWFLLQVPANASNLEAAQLRNLIYNLGAKPSQVLLLVRDQEHGRTRADLRTIFQLTENQVFGLPCLSDNPSFKSQLHGIVGRLQDNIGNCRAAKFPPKQVAVVPELSQHQIGIQDVSITGNVPLQEGNAEPIQPWAVGAEPAGASGAPEESLSLPLHSCMHQGGTADHESDSRIREDLVTTSSYRVYHEAEQRALNFAKGLPQDCFIVGKIPARVHQASDDCEQILDRLPVGSPLQQELFPFAEIEARVAKVRSDHKPPAGETYAEKQCRLARQESYLAELSRAREVSKPSDFICFFGKALARCANDPCAIDEVRAIVTVIQQRQGPKLESMLKGMKTLKARLAEQRQVLGELASTTNLPKVAEPSLASRQGLEEQISQLEAEIKALDHKISANTVTAEYCFRELAFAKQAGCLSAELPDEQHMKGLARFLLEGYPLELLDGDNLEMQTTLMTRVIRCLQDMLVPGLQNEGQGARPYFVSVLGPQSSGKSTYMNFLFGSRFQVSAGRCTKGLYFSAIPTDLESGAAPLVVLDTEGLLSIERADPDFDKQVTLFAMAQSDEVLINVNGEINKSMSDILGIAVFALDKLKLMKKRPKITFVLRNMSSLDKSKQAEMISGIRRTVEDVCQVAGVKMEDIVDFKDEESFVLMPDAFHSDSIRKPSIDGDKQLRVADVRPVNSLFRERANEHRQQILLEAGQGPVRQSFVDLKQWISTASATWDCIQRYNDLFQVKDAEELRQRAEISESYSHTIQCFEDEWESTELPRILEKHGGDLSFESHLHEALETHRVNLRETLHRRCPPERFPHHLIEEYEATLRRNLNSAKQSALELCRLLQHESKVDARIKKRIQHMNKWIEQKVLSMVKEAGSSEGAKQETLDEFEKQWTRDEKALREELKSDLPTKDSVVSTVERYFVEVIEQLPHQDRAYGKSDVSCDFGGQCQTQLLQPMVSWGELTRHIRGTRDHSKIVPRGSQAPPPVHKREAGSAPVCDLISRIGSNLVQGMEVIHKVAEQVLPPSAVKKWEEDRLHETSLQVIAAIVEDTRKRVEALVVVEFRTVKQLIKGLAESVKREEGKLALLDYHFGPELRGQFFGHCLELVVAQKRSLLDSGIEESMSKFKKNKNIFEKMLVSQIDKGLGDVGRGAQLAGLLIDMVVAQKRDWAKDDHIAKMRQAAVMRPDDLMALCRKTAFVQGASEDDVFLYATNFNAFMEKVFTRNFEDKSSQVLRIVDQTASQQVSDALKNMIQHSEDLHRMLALYQHWHVPQSSQAKEAAQELCKAYLDSVVPPEEVLSHVHTLNFALMPTPSDALELPYFADSKGLGFLAGPLSQACTFDNPVIFLQAFHEGLADKTKSLRMRVKPEQKQLEREKARLRVGAFGCQHTCPYCGAKCENPTPDHAEHYATHRMAAFNGSWEADSGGRKKFVMDVCNTHKNYSKLWHLPPNYREGSMDPEMRQRATEYGTGVGQLTIRLKWNDWNDLDLHVHTPRGEKICFRDRRGSCGGFLDVDMNFERHSDRPIENIFWEKLPPLGIYCIQVHYFANRGGSPSTTAYQVEILNSGPTGGRVIQQHSGRISQADGFVTVCEFVNGLTFPEHCKKAFPVWNIPCCSHEEEVSLAGDINKQQQAFQRIARRLARHYNIDHD